MDSTRLTMKAELEDALGERVSDDEARRALERPGTRAAWLRSNRLLVLITGATALVVGAILSLALGSVWLTVFALAVHLAGTFVVATLAIKLLTEVEKPAPTVVARLEAAGVDDAEQRLNMAIRSHGGESRAAEQTDSMTPSADGTRLAGPGSEESLREAG
jgi:hypothetical protein